MRCAYPEVEECQLRVSTDGNSTETSSLIENRGQRLEIFQQHLLSLIYFENSKIIEDVKFNNWINSRKDESNQIINDIIRKCIDYFLENRQLMEANYIIHTTKIKNNQILLQQKISLEVMSYLCNNAKFNYNLRYLLFYSMYEIYQYEKHKLIRQNIKTQQIEKICQYTVRIIMRNSWILAFKNTKINEVNIKTQHNIIKINKNRISCTSSPLEIFLQDIQDGTKGKSTKNINSLTINASQLSSVERDKLKTPTTLGYSFNAMQYGTGDKTTKVKSEKPVSVNCKVVTEINTDENTAIQFSFMVNEFIKADNRMGIKNLDGKPVKSLVEIWHYARVYKFSQSFELTVTNYTDSLFPNDGYLVDYPDYKTRADVAMLFETMISNDSFEFIKTVEHNDKLVINSCYDPSVFLLLELLEYCQIEEHISDKYKFKPIEFNTVMQCMIDAADKATKSGIPLINGMLLHSLFTAAKEELK